MSQDFKVGATAGAIARPGACCAIAPARLITPGAALGQRRATPHAFRSVLRERIQTRHWFPAG
jgi:hypothetical protein